MGVACASALSRRVVCASASSPVKWGRVIPDLPPTQSCLNIEQIFPRENALKSLRHYTHTRLTVSPVDLNAFGDARKVWSSIQQRFTECRLCAQALCEALGVV